MEADDGCAAHGIAHEHRHKQERRVHDDTIGGHAILSGKAEQLVVVQDVHQGHGQVAHQLRGAVGAGVQQDLSLKAGAAQMDAAGVVLFQEVEHRQHAAHHLADHGGNGRALHTPAQRAHQQHVQHHVGAACAHGKGKAQMGLFGRDKKALEHILQNERGQAEHQDAAIAHRVVQHLPFCAQQHRRRAKHQHTQCREEDAGDQRSRQEQAEAAVSLFLVALPQGDAHDGAAAGPQHKAHCTHQHRQRHDEVDGGKGGFAHKVRDTQAVHDAVNGGEQHGADTGQHEPQQPRNVEMIG